MQAASIHSFDQAIALEPVGDHRWRGATHPAWQNMVGPFGGISAATALQAVLRSPDLLGTPLALTVNYASAIASGAFEIEAIPVRTNRSTQHWTISLTQADAQGQAQVALTATAVTAIRRSTWQGQDVNLPSLRPPSEVERRRVPTHAWTERYEMRIAQGALPTTWDGTDHGSRTQMWVRDDPPRPVDFVALASLADVFFPRVYLARALAVPAGTVSITSYFHANDADLARVGDGYLLAEAWGQAYRHGFFDQAARLWSADGQLLVSSQQVVYFKE